MADSEYTREKVAAMMPLREQPHSSSQGKKGKASPARKELQDKLLELLSIGRLVITPDWNYLAGDWVTSVHAADIDDDGDIEIVAGSRDGYVRALTRQGTLRWETCVGLGRWITAIAVIPSPEPLVDIPSQDLAEDVASSILKASTGPGPRIIVGTRDGKVYALDQYGKQVDNWFYHIKHDQVIHQIAIHRAHPDEVVVGAEDRSIHLLNSKTGALIWHRTIKGRVYSVCVADIDGDGDQEILAAATDKCIHILSRQGTSRGSIKLLHKSYAIAAVEAGKTDPNTGEEQSSGGERRPALIFSSYNGKDLYGWTVVDSASNPAHDQLTLHRTWPPRPPQPSHAQAPSISFQGRTHAIHIADINNDGQPELLIGSADYFFYVFDHYGQLLWKHSFGQSIYSIYACDYDDDGITEVIVGLGDNNIRALKIELNPRHEFSPRAGDTHSEEQFPRPPLYPQIQQTMQKLRRSGMKIPTITNDALAEIANNLGLMQDEEPKQKKREFYLARYKLSIGEYKEALALLLRLKEQGVQQYWSQPLTNLGHIRDLGFGDVLGNPIDEIIVGNDEGELIALDINDEKEDLWKPRPQLGSSIVSLQTGNPQHEDYETTLAILEDRRICLLNNLGQLMPLPTTLLEPDDRVSALSVATSQTEGIHRIEQIVLGLENHKIYVYDAQLRQRLATIHTGQSVSLLCACGVTGHRQTDILAATAQHAVQLYVQQKKEPGSYTKQWEYQAEDRVRALCAADIDRDGQIEIIIGSEDRNLSVLNHCGQLKWRYFMPDAVLSVDVCNIDMDARGESEVLAGVDDGFVYLFSCQGDLLQKLAVHDRVRAVRAKDLHPASHSDGMVEIAVATDDRLMLLQVLHDAEIYTLIEECWRYLRNNVRLRDLLYAYGDYRREKNDYIRAFALTRLAGQPEHFPEDFALLRRAIAEDPSLIVSQALAKAIVNLCHTSQPGGASFQQSRQLLRRLSQKPQRETRIAIVNMLDELARTNPDLSFEYLEGFLGNADLWLRRMVIRQLSNLAAAHPRRVFRLLRISTHDEHPWIRQESGRGLARYFDSQPQTLFSDLHELLGRGIDPAITEQIAISSQQPAIARLLEAHSRFQRAIQRRLPNLSLDKPLDSLQNRKAATTFQEQKKGYEADLAAFVTALQETMALLPQAEDLLVVYQELQNVLQVGSTDDIEQFHRLTAPGEIGASRHFQYIDALVSELLTIVEAIKLYQKREAFSDKATTLIEANYTLSQIRNQYLEDRHEALHDTQQPAKALCPEDALLRIALQHWYALLRKELSLLHGLADLSIELTPNDVQREETVELFFKVSNTGRSAADHVRVAIDENPGDYAIVGSAERMVEEVSSQHPQIVGFTLKPLVDSFRIETIVTYQDAERSDHFFKQGHKIELKKSYAEFKKIPNPYHGGTPTSDSKMFYGRAEDLRSLGETLSSTTASANRIILLIGQRRSGKTSLIYQLESRLQPHLVVHIDLQSLAMSTTTGELFCKIASAIHRTLLGRDFPASEIDEGDFRENPTQTFDRYLEQVTRQLEGRRLILLIDEFEVFNQLIEQQRLDAHFLHYLRSLMQHRLGVNFLLAGAPHVLLDDLNNRSAFLNIAQHHHLSRLKHEEAEQLIVAPVHPLLVYDPLALERIHALTGDQPYLIHLLCEVLIQHCNKQRKNYANTNDINAIIKTVLERGENYFGMIWGQASSPEERLVLAILAGDTTLAQKPMYSLADLKKAFSDVNCPYHAEKIRRALRHLKQEEIIEEENEGRFFIIPVGLIRTWLRQNNVPARIAREEFATLEIEG